MTKKMKTFAMINAIISLLLVCSCIIYIFIKVSTLSFQAYVHGSEYAFEYGNFYILAAVAAFLPFSLDSFVKNVQVVKKNNYTEEESKRDVISSIKLEILNILLMIPISIEIVNIINDSIILYLSFLILLFFVYEIVKHSRILVLKEYAKPDNYSASLIGKSVDFIIFVSMIVLIIILAKPAWDALGRMIL